MSGPLSLDAESLYQTLCKGVATLLTPNSRLVGITSGGAWLATRLQKDLQGDQLMTPQEIYYLAKTADLMLSVRDAYGKK